MHSLCILGAPVASDRTCDPVAATEAEAATEAATEPPRARDRKIAEACDRACDRQRPKKRGQQLLRPGVFSHLVETKRLRPNCDRCDRDRDRATGATKSGCRQHDGALESSHFKSMNPDVNVCLFSCRIASRFFTQRFVS